MCFEYLSYLCVNQFVGYRMLTILTPECNNYLLVLMNRRRCYLKNNISAVLNRNYNIAFKGGNGDKLLWELKKRKCLKN